MQPPARKEIPTVNRRLQRGTAPPWRGLRRLFGHAFPDPRCAVGAGISAERSASEGGFRRLPRGLASGASRRREARRLGSDGGNRRRFGGSGRRLRLGGGLAADRPTGNRPTALPASSGPNPPMAPGLLKSQAYSDSPTWSRIAGSSDHILRIAAFFSAAGTPSRRKAERSPSAVRSSRLGGGSAGFGSVAAPRQLPVGVRASFRRAAAASASSASQRAPPACAATSGRRGIVRRRSSRRLRGSDRPACAIASGSARSRLRLTNGRST